MQVIDRCRKLIIGRNTQIAWFHYTPICFDKWRNKWNSEFKGTQTPSKNYARYTIRQKRADTKKALKNLLNHYGDQGTTFKNDGPWSAYRTKGCGTDTAKKTRLKSEHLRAEKIHNHKMRRNFRKRSLGEDDDDYPKTKFEATFGDKYYTWSFEFQNESFRRSRDPWNGSSRRTSHHFDWRETFRGANGGGEGWGSTNEPIAEDETCYAGLPADRAALGLSPKGPLKIKDVKKAFHLSALKWHPDKHQGPTQAAAEEKFKLCVNAYNSLCSALSGA